MNNVTKVTHSHVHNICEQLSSVTLHTDMNTDVNCFHNYKLQSQ